MSIYLHCGTCHMASLFTSLPRTATPTIISEVVLWACQHQLPQALAASTAHRNITTSIQMGPHATSCASPANAGPLLTTSVSSPSHFSTSLLKPRGLNFFLHEDCPGNLTEDFYCRNKFLGSNRKERIENKN